ncbi:MAG: glycosyltransferase family 2 protein [Candidatus Kuenenia sp.]|nr:glycosyltransferase family 2 protein [Candidatus Kuenenia hertensis]
MESLITTIIPTYRRPYMLRKAILSVLDQTYSHFQVCVYDNASGDETSDIVAEIARKDPRVKYHCHHANIGAVGNFNYGMKQVKTPYFSFLSDDNTLLPGFYEDALNTLNQYPEAVFIAGKTIGVNKKGKNYGGASLDCWEAGLIYPPEGLLNIIENGSPILEGVLFRSKVLNDVGLFDPTYHGAIDQDFMLRISRNNIFYISKRKYAVYLYHENSWQENRELREFVATRKKLLQKWCQDPGLSDDIKRRIKKMLKKYIERIITDVVVKKCILGEDNATLILAAEVMKKEIGFSFKSYRTITVARYVNYNRLLKKLVQMCFYLYIHRKK